MADVDVSLTTYALGAVVTAVAAVLAVMAQKAVSVPGQMMWEPTTGRLVVSAGWRSPRERAWLEFFYVSLAIAVGAHQLARLTRDDDAEVDRPTSVTPTAFWRLAIFMYNISGFSIGAWLALLALRARSPASRRRLGSQPCSCRTCTSRASPRTPPSSCS